MLIWPSNENYGTNCNNLDMLIKEIRERNGSWQGWSHRHHWSFRKSLPATVQWRTWPNNWLNSSRKMKMRTIVEPKMQMKDLTDILSAINMAAEKFWDFDLDWERSSTVKRGIRAILHPYYEIFQEKKKISKQLMLHLFWCLLGLL